MTTQIGIKELDPDIIPPRTSRVNDPEYGGSKIVVVGKPGCFTKGTRIMLSTGDGCNVEDITVGDFIMGDDSVPRKVLELCNNSEEMFEIQPESGESYTVNRSHKLVLVGNDEIIREITVNDYIGKPQDWKDNHKVFRVAVNFYEKEVPFDSYNYGNNVGNSLRNHVGNSTRTSKPSKFEKITCISSVHNIYKYNSPKVRSYVLAGFIDKNGEYDEKANAYIISGTKSILSKDILFLARTLGLTATDKDSTISITGSISRLPSLKYKPKKYGINNLRSKFKVESKGVGEYFGFTIDCNHRFLLESCDVVRITGISTLIKSIIWYKKHIFPVGVAFSGTEDSNHAYKQWMPSIFTYNDYYEEKFKDFVKRQKMAKEYLKENPWAFIIADDCTDDPKIFNKPLQQGMYKRGRHWKMLYILSLQYAMDVKPVIRTNVDGIFILREPLLKNRKSLWENYASIVPDFATFCDLMDQLTDDYCSIYIHNAAGTNTWQDCVFYYRAPIERIPKDWKFGHPTYIDHHNQRYNSEYIEPHEF